MGSRVFFFTVTLGYSKKVTLKMSEDLSFSKWTITKNSPISPHPGALSFKLCTDVLFRNGHYDALEDLCSAINRTSILSCFQRTQTPLDFIVEWDGWGELLIRPSFRCRVCLQTKGGLFEQGKCLCLRWQPGQ